LVQLGDDLLLALGVVDPRRAQTYRLVERLQRIRLGIDVHSGQRLDHAIHDAGDRVRAGELVALEQGVEHRLGDHVLGEHLDRPSAGDRLVEVPSYGVEEYRELVRGGGVGVDDEGGDAGDVIGRDRGDVLGPLVPVGARADLGDHLRVD